MQWSSCWLGMMMIAAAFTVFFNSKFQSAQSAEKKVEAAKRVFEILKPEIALNETVADNMLTTLSDPHNIPTQSFGLSAWHTVSAGGALLNLEPEIIAKLTTIYALTQRCIEIRVQLLEHSIGINAAMSGSAQVRDTFRQNLIASTQELKTTLHAFVDGNP